MAKERPLPPKEAYRKPTSNERLKRGTGYKYSGSMPRASEVHVKIDPNTGTVIKPNISGKADYTQDYKKLGVPDKPLPFRDRFGPYLVVPVLALGAGLARSYAAKHPESFLGNINDFEYLRVVSAGVPVLGALGGYIHEARVLGAGLMDFEGEEIIGGAVMGGLALICEQAGFYAGSMFL